MEMKYLKIAVITSICFFTFMHGRAETSKNAGEDKYSAQRMQMVAHDLKARDISDPEVLAAMKKRAESAEATLRVARVGRPKHAAQQTEAPAIAE